MRRSKVAGTVAFVGVAKNTGKTTTLNRLVEATVRTGRRLGLVSVGIDGEAADALSGTDKPAIYLPAGHWVASAGGALDRSSARFEYVDMLGFETPMGRACIARVIDAGEVCLAGMRHREDIRRARRALFERGVDRVFVDGAYGRMAAADGRLADAVVLSTGAVLDASIGGIVEQTRRFAGRLRLSGIGRPIDRRMLERSVAEGRVLIRRGEAIVDPEIESALVELGDRADLLDEGVEAVAIPGVVSRGVVRALIDAPVDEATLLVAAPSSIQVDTETWQALADSQWRVEARHAVDLAAISANPVAVQGWRVDSGELVDALREAWPDYPVFDPVMADDVMSSTLKSYSDRSNSVRMSIEGRSSEKQRLSI
jgi:hypothetical protein